MDRRLKVLFSAYACEPDTVSETGVGWNWVCQADRFHAVWAITRPKNRVSIESSLAAEPLPKVPGYVLTSPWVRFRNEARRGTHAHYYLWQLGVYFVAKRRHREVGFNMVYYATSANY